MKSFKTFIAVLLLIWTPLFFSGAAFAAMQMELANMTLDANIQPTHACHQPSNAESNSTDLTHQHTAPHIQHCGFCVVSIAPLPDLTTVLISFTPPLSSHIMWVPLSHISIPQHRPPIDA